jgi:hypothetical protein
MKRSISLLAITFLVFGCSAAFGEGLVTLGFKGHDGTQYCEYENFSYGTSLASGIDVMKDCNLPDSTMIGVTTNGTTHHLSGPVVMLADSIVDAQCNCYSQEQWMILTKTKASSTSYGWELYYNTYDAFHEYLDNYGYLTKHLGP